MSLTKLNNGWYRYNGGMSWRIQAPHYTCEVGREANTPAYTDPDSITKIKRVKSFYQRTLRLGKIDVNGYGIDIMVANAFTESSGNVPTPVSTTELASVYNTVPGNDAGAKLDAVVRYLGSRRDTKSLLRMEPGYSTPIGTPGRLSLGAHHVLINTALWLQGKYPRYQQSDVVELVTRLPAESKFAASLAEVYFDKHFTKHLLQPPLLAACYNAGSIRPSSSNVWGMVSTTNHIDKWIKYFNTSRLLNKPSNAVPVSSTIIPPVVTYISPSRDSLTSIESIITQMKNSQYAINEDESKPYNLNIIGLRNSNGRLNVFDDRMAVFWKYEGKWNLRFYTITTEPGAKFINSASTGGRILNQLGTAILVPGQYLNSHILATHKGYPALKQYGNLRVYRDQNMNSHLDYDARTIKVAGPDCAINIHRANASRTSIEVGAWSAGCQVFANPQEFQEFIDLCGKRSSNWGKVFTYSLLLV